MTHHVGSLRIDITYRTAFYGVGREELFERERERDPDCALLGLVRFGTCPGCRRNRPALKM